MSVQEISQKEKGKYYTPRVVGKDMETGKYLSGLDAKNIQDKDKITGFFIEVDPGTNDSIIRTYTSPEGTGQKIERIVPGLRSNINRIGLQEGQYGTTIFVALGNDEDNVVISTGVKSVFGKDLLHKLPNVKEGQEVEIKPYHFIGDGGKTYKGISIFGEENISIPSIYKTFDPKTKKNNYVADYPFVEGDWDKLPQTKKDKHTIAVIEFLIEGIKKHPLYVEDFKTTEIVPVEEETDVKDIAF